jgi:hypothetical protein
MHSERGRSTILRLMAALYGQAACLLTDYPPVMAGLVERRMPRFFFHVRNQGQGLSRDLLGLDFPDVETACREATRAARELGEEFATRGENPGDYVIDVVNASGEAVFSLPFSRLLYH